MKISELKEFDVVCLTPGKSWVLTSDVVVDGLLASFTARMEVEDGWSPEQELTMPAALLADVIHAWRSVQAPCLLCTGTYPHRMDVIVSSSPCGICRTCNRRTTDAVTVER